MVTCWENWSSRNSLIEKIVFVVSSVVAILAIAGDSSAVNLAAAWGYVGLRIIHSLWQGLVNIVKIRAALFALSSVCLLVLAFNAVRLTLGF